jgi:hypothetical protein
VGKGRGVDSRYRFHRGPSWVDLAAPGGRIADRLFLTKLRSCAFAVQAIKSPSAAVPRRRFGGLDSLD